MKLVVDASVFIAFVIPEEKEHLTAARFISACVTGGHRIIIPALAWLGDRVKSALRPQTDKIGYENELLR